MSVGWQALLIGLWVVTVVVVVICLGLSRRVQALEAMLNNVGKPEIAPPIDSEVDIQMLVADGELQDADKIALLFHNVGCPHCGRLMAEFGEESAGIAELLGVPVVIATNDVAAVDSLGASRVVHDDGAIADSFGVRVTPVAVAVDRGGRVLASGPVPSVEAVRELIQSGRVASEASEPPGLAVFRA